MSMSQEALEIEILQLLQKPNVEGRKQCQCLNQRHRQHTQEAGTGHRCPKFALHHLEEQLSLGFCEETGGVHLQSH